MKKRSIARIKESKKIRSRSGSCGNIEMWKRKRKESGKGGEGEEEAFSGSKKTVREAAVFREWDGKGDKE